MNPLENQLEQYESKVKADLTFAQLLIYIDTEKSSKKAQEIIKELGIRIFKAEKLSPNVVLLKLETKDMRDIVLKLTENGFLNIKGYNAASSKI